MRSNRPTSRTFRDIVIGTAFGAGLGVLTVVGSLIWAGSMLGFRSEGEASAAWPLYVLALSFVGLMGGLLRPLMHTLHGQLLFSFSAMFALFVGFGASSGVMSDPVGSGLVRAALATPLLVVVGRWGGGFDLIQRGKAEEEGSITDGGVGE